MKRWTLLLFLLLLPLTMAPRTSLVPVDELEVMLVASQTTLESGDAMSVVGQVRNVGDSTAVAPTVSIHVRAAEKVEVTLERPASGCTADGEAMSSVSAVHCSVRDLRPNQQAAFRFSLRFHGDGPVTLTSAELSSTTPPENTVVVTVTDPSGGDR